MSQIPIEVEEVILLSNVADNGPPDDEYLDPLSISQAEVSDIRLITMRQRVPEGWYPCDGSAQRSWEWPEFVELMRIGTEFFHLPEPERVADGHQYIIKLGEHREYHEPPPRGTLMPERSAGRPAAEPFRAESLLKSRTVDGAQKVVEK